MNNYTDTQPDVSILIATYNRAESLRQTLTAMQAVDRADVNTEIVVIDNNSSDYTKEVVESFRKSLPVRYLFEPRPGKNKALNHALDTIDLGEIVVFCDDDIVPAENWLREIVRSCQRWPNYSVFGGKIYLVWPQTDVPKWAKSPSIHGWAFTRHDDIADTDTPYPAGGHPPGPNFWVRRSVFDDGRRYDESIGPKAGGKFFMGSETSFLFQLARDGYPGMHIPEAVVGHRVQPELLTPESIKKRVYRYGGGFYHLRHLPRRRLLQKHPLIWRLVQVLVLAKWVLYYVRAWFSLSADRRLLRKLTAIRWLACNIEGFKVAAASKSNETACGREQTQPEISAQFVPFWVGNPYQIQLAEHLNAKGVRMEETDSLKLAFNRYLFKGRRFTVLHIHWLPSIDRLRIVSVFRVMAYLLRLWILRLCGVKLVWTVHNIKSHEEKIQAFDGWIRQRLARWADALIAHSPAAKRQIIEAFKLQDTEKIFVVPHGNYIKSYQNDVSYSAARRELNLPDDVFVVLFFGGVRPYKGIRELIEAFKTIGSERARLLIAGNAMNAAYTDEINRQITGDTTIRWDNGYIEPERVHYYLSACDAAVFPYRELFSSGAAILAMSFGRACIVPSTETIREVLDESGAFFYEPQSADGLENALRAAMDKQEQLRQMGAHNLQLAKHWDWEVIADRTARIYRWCQSGKKEQLTAEMPLRSGQVIEG